MDAGQVDNVLVASFFYTSVLDFVVIIYIHSCLHCGPLLRLEAEGVALLIATLY